MSYPHISFSLSFCCWINLFFSYRSQIPRLEERKYLFQLTTPPTSTSISINHFADGSKVPIYKVFFCSSFRIFIPLHTILCWLARVTSLKSTIVAKDVEKLFLSKFGLLRGCKFRSALIIPAYTVDCTEVIIEVLNSDYVKVEISSTVMEIR